MKRIASPTIKNSLPMSECFCLLSRMQVVDLIGVMNRVSTAQPSEDVEIKVISGESHGVTVGYFHSFLTLVGINLFLPVRDDSSHLGSNETLFSIRAKFGIREAATTTISA